MSKQTKTIRTYNYSKDKRLWLHLEKGGKIKLRKYLSEVARKLIKVNQDSYEVNRHFLIKAYNKGGLKTVKLWVDEQFKNLIKDEN